MTFSPTGDRIAIATKTNELMVIDPRSPEVVMRGKAHDSARSFQVDWIDASHLISVGFSKGSARTINLYRLSPSSSTLEIVQTTSIDVSPAVLFPIYDPDTHILYIWGKGERVIQAFEINTEPKSGGEAIMKLPGFTSGTPQLGFALFPKRMVDVKKVEVAKGLRLTAKTLEEVSFSIPRNKVGYFRMDNFPIEDEGWLIHLYL